MVRGGGKLPEGEYDLARVADAIVMGKVGGADVVYDADEKDDQEVDELEDDLDLMDIVVADRISSPRRETFGFEDDMGGFGMESMISPEILAPVALHGEFYSYMLCIW